MIRPYYAVKCNPDRALLQTLSSFGAGFDCASGRELTEVSEIGYGKEKFKDRVVYANPCKPNRDLQKAKLFGSPTTVVDSCEEVDKLKSVGWEGSALIRLLVEDKGSIMPFSRKFGLKLTDVGKVSAYANKKGIPLTGVSFHVGSGCQDPKQYASAMSQALTSMKTMKENGHTCDMIDIGGGFLPDPKAFAEYARVIRCGMRNALENKSLRYIAEPGRFFATDSYDLFVQVIGKKPSLDGEGWRYTIDESLYGQFSCIPFDHKKPTWIRVPTVYEHKKVPRRTVKGTLFGRTCDSLDMIAKSDAMEELEVGDWLWFPNMGAYTSVTASEFNGFPKPPIHGTETNYLLPSTDDLVTQGYKNRFPESVSTVTAVSINE